MADYLIHFNKNHDPKNGRFAPGDGNGDGIVGSHKSSHNGTSKEDRRKAAKRTLVTGIVEAAAIAPLSALVSAKSYKEGEKFVSGLWFGTTVAALTSGVGLTIAGAKELAKSGQDFDGYDHTTKKPY